jgi:hemerythrin-like domain-containing protein
MRNDSLRTDQFRADHERQFRILAWFEKELSRTARPFQRAIPVGLLRHLVDFLGTDIAGHFAAEEQTIYRCVMNHTERNRMITSLAVEHEQLRREIHSLRNLVAKGISGEVADDHLLPAFQILHRRLVGHMNKEGAIIFPIVEQGERGRAAPFSPEVLQP